MYTFLELSLFDFGIRIMLTSNYFKSVSSFSIL